MHIRNMAVSKEDFYTSARNDFLLNLRHCLKFSWANFLASAFIFISKLSLVVLNCFSCYCIMKYITHDIEEVSYIVSPLVVIGVITYISASVFFGLFDETVLNIMTCLAIDCDLNGEPVSGPPTFHDALDGFEKTPSNNAIRDGGKDK